MERYKGIIPDWPEFLKAMGRPLPLTLRVNTLKVGPGTLKERLEAKGLKVEVADWCPILFTVKGVESLGLLLEHFLGLYHVQEASSLLAPMALEPKPGEVVLDICAAPGGKATHIAQLMENKGTIVANDVQPRRLSALSGNLSRLGVTNALITAYNGLRFPDVGFRFDRALVDAPCSGEGNARKDPKVKGGAEPFYIRWISGVQKGLLLRAIDLVKPGGVVVYSTCTFAPEENEAVVQHALERRDVRIEPLSLPVPHSPGLTEWEGRRFHPDMEGCARIYPHHFDSGGAFVAKLRKLSDEGRKEGPSFSGGGPAEATGEVAACVVAMFKERFGVPPERFEGVKFVTKGEDIWAATASPKIASLYGKCSSFGIRVAKVEEDGRLRPTDWGLFWLGREVGRNFIDLSAEALESLLALGSLKVGGARAEEGYVAIRFEGEVVGAGLKRGDTLRLRMQKARREMLLEILRAEGGRRL
ncbi:MAG TPA: RsmB/NOP family class I SAM-dependent RNA methyltransferase [Armatimonadetes bacterium]|nr:RsmB/NOP family class I SAM-dependent RNA methyltransferase [Armatimonadota bacterium]